MIHRFAVFDVETPNRYNNRMSAIGITVVENGIISSEFYTLINPQVRFDRFNIMLTGITPEMVKNEPTFPEAWQMIAPIMENSILIAHNAPFDMRVLAGCLAFHNISWKDYADYACTCTIGKKCLPELENHKLDTMCRHLNIPLNHHNAGSDSRASAELLRYYLDSGADIDSYLRRYNFKTMKTERCKNK